MGFKSLKNTRLLRRWSLAGFPGDGKSSFAAQMQAPLLPIDVDGRFNAVSHLTEGEVYALSDERSDNNDVQAIDRNLDEKMPGSGVKTIVVDSVTPLFQSVTRRHKMAEHEGNSELKNKSSMHAEKADLMALLGTAVSSWGTDTLWIWHLNETNFSGSTKLTETVSNTERERLRKFLDAELQVAIDDKGRRGIKITWSRYGSGQDEIVWETDENIKAKTYWRGIPEKIDALLHPVTAQGAKPAGIPPGTKPTSFTSADEAIKWGAGELELEDAKAKALYNEVKERTKPTKPSEMWNAWIAEIDKRKTAALQPAA